MKKYLVLGSSFLTQTALGGAYAWSFFLAASAPDGSPARASADLAFALGLVSFALSALGAGLALKTLSNRLLGLSASLLFGATLFCSNLFTDQGLLPHLVFGILLGAASGVLYLNALSALDGWFPRHGTLARGFGFAGLGLGAMIAVLTLDPGLQTGADSVSRFQFLPGAWAVLPLAASAVLSKPPKGYEGPQAEILSLRYLVYDRRFVALAAAMLGSGFSALLFVGKAGALSSSLGMETKGVLVLFSLGAAIGGLFWSWLSELAPRLSAQINVGAVVLLSLSPAIVSFGTDEAGLFILASGFLFGGTATVFASKAEKLYGLGAVKYLYPYLLAFLAVGCALLLPLVNAILSQSRSYFQLVLLGSPLPVVGFALYLFFMKESGDGDSKTEIENLEKLE